jgi:spore coat protein U-like protein
MRRILFVLTGIAVVSIAAESRLVGQTQSTSLTVSAVVVKNCTITTAPVAFGNYDSVAANATTPLDGIGTTRRMAGAAAEFLLYELYKDTGHATIWGDTVDNALDIPAAPNRNPRNFTVYGRVAAAQDAAVGNYTDTVVATVNF